MNLVWEPSSAKEGMDVFVCLSLLLNFQAMCTVFLRDGVRVDGEGGSGSTLTKNKTKNKTKTKTKQKKRQ